MASSSEFNNNSINNASNYKGKNNISSNSFSSWKNSPTTQPAPPKKNIEAKHEHNKKRITNISKILTTFATMVSATALCIVGVDSLASSTVTTSMFETMATENEIYYCIELENYGGEDDLIVVLYNDFTNRSQKINGIEAYGVFDHLQTNMVYTLALKQGSTIITCKKLRTVYNEELQKDYTERDDFDTGQPKKDDLPMEEIADPDEPYEPSQGSERPITADNNLDQTEPIIADDIPPDVNESDEDQPLEEEDEPSEQDLEADKPTEEEEAGYSSYDQNNPTGQNQNNNDNITGPNDGPTNDYEGDLTNG